MHWFDVELERFVLLGCAVTALLAGLWTGLVRLGVGLPMFGAPQLVIQHGPLMIVGFLGIVIPLERAVAVETRTAFVIPFLSVIGVGLLLVPVPGAYGKGVIVLASLGYLGLFLYFSWRDPALYNAVMTGGAVLWVVGNILWTIGWRIPAVVGLWAGFLILTIAGERLELARTVRLDAWQKWVFGVISGGFAIGCFGPVVPEWMVVRILFGAGLVALALWLIVFGTSRRTVWIPGRHRFMAVNLLLGYLWLLFAGGYALYQPWTMAGPMYDALLHAVFVGFVFSMIFAHAPVIFPAITGQTLTYLPVFYVHTLLLHVFLAVRVFGDLSGSYGAREVGSIMNAVAILLFLLHSIMGVLWTDSDA